MSWNVRYVALILLTTAVSYGCARLMEKAQSQSVRKACLTGCLFVCLGCLFIFKYFNWFFESLDTVFSWAGLSLHPVTLTLLLPVGISFYTFQTLSYVIDVYKGKIPAEHHFGMYAAFISFFPQLVAGPIERSENLLPQIKKKRSFCYDQASYGIRLMNWGFFKKVVIADILAVYVDIVFGDISAYSGLALICAGAGFAVQIYCDFSGYSDIAIGTAKLFGIDLMTNFKSPYFSTSIQEFWHRWHISLSTWFRDYVYIPLGGNRCSKLRQKCNIMITFLLSGLWHGASWTYVIWGGCHGILQCAEKPLLNKRDRMKWKRLGQFTAWVVCLSLCTLAWVFFRAETIGDAFYFFIHMFDGMPDVICWLKDGWHMVRAVYSFFTVCVLAFAMMILFVYDYISLKHDCILLMGKLPKIVRWTVYITISVIWISALLLSISSESQSTFIYFQF